MDSFWKVLENNKIKKIVCGDNINVKINGNFEITTMDDVRSAAFYAFGESKILNKNVVLLVDGDYLPNVYTVLTEAWFQKTDLVVIAFFDSIYDVDTNYLNRCSVGNVQILERDIVALEEKINTLLNKKGPKIISVVLDHAKCIHSNDYEKEILQLKKVLAPQDEVICYNSNTIYSGGGYINIAPKYKYGIISKYCASIMDIKNRRILLCDDSCMKIDSNIFNNRYVNKNLKIIVKTNDINFNIKNWIESNNILYVETQNIGKSIKDLYYSDKPMVLVIKGGK